VEPPTRKVRAERRAMVALVAVFALLVQALMPAFAIAGPMPDGATLICTDMGLQAAPSDSTPPAVDHACKHCLCPAPASGPPATASVVRVAYAVATAPAVEVRRTLPPPARAPPRPPGQGPPASDA
jgi:hypothetical protein